MNIKNRLAQLEKRADEKPGNPITEVDVFAVAPDGTKILIETWRQLVEADAAGELADCPQWQRVVHRYFEDT